MSIPLVSIVIVTYNRPLQIISNRIISSLQRQDYPNLEIVVIGNNCPHFDELNKILRSSFHDKALKTINIPPDKNKFVWESVGKCKNIGVEMATGELVSCQDDDNELEPDFISSLYKCMQENNVDAVWSYRKIRFDDGNLYQGDFFPWIPRTSNRHDAIYKIWTNAGIITPGSDILQDQLIALNNSEVFSTIDANSWLVKKEILQKIRFRENYGFENIYSYKAVDDLWNLDLRNAAVRVACSKKPSLIYYLGGNSTTHH